MPANKRSVPLLESERAPVPGARRSGRLDPNERILVTVILRPRSSNKERSAAEELGMRMPLERTYPTREEFAAKYGATREDLARVEDFARENALGVVEVSPAKRSVVLSGTVAQFGRAFNVRLSRYKHPQKGVYRARTGPVYLPRELAPLVQAVLGLDNRPQAQSHTRILKKRGTGGVTYTPPQVAQLYDFPASLDGTGQSVAIVELGGGYAMQDLETYFSSLGIDMPDILAVSVDGASNAPTGDPSGPDGEVMLDIEVIGSIAPKAQISVYFAPNTDAGFVDAVTTAVHDVQHKPSVISISWGSAESSWTAQGIKALDQAFQDAAVLGVTVCAAAGDGGSSDGVNDGLAHVDFPASSQYVIGCGGTRLKSSGKKIESEVVWNDMPSDGAGGGGVSGVFALPSWQDAAGVPPSANPGGHVGRGVPDVAGDADPQTGYMIRVDGKQAPIGGTSAVAPLWTGLLALVNQRLGKAVGYLNPVIYDGAKFADTGAFRDIVTGNNGAYDAGPGWDACTGLGSPEGTKLLAALRQSGGKRKGGKRERRSRAPR